MRRLLAAIAAVCLFWAGGQSGALARVIYVDVNGWGGDGTSWSDAYDSIQDALNAAGHGDQVWVAEGTYYENLNVSRAIEMYGSFTGTESQPDERPTGEPRTIIDADVDGDPDTEDGNCLNSMNPAVTVLDGFKFINGTGSELPHSGGNGTHGGGVYLRGFRGSIVNCVFENNSAEGRGGGLHIESNSNVDGEGPMTLTDVVFRDNSAGQGGGLYLESQDNDGSFPIEFNRVTFNLNHAGEGGGLYVDTFQWFGYMPDQNGDPAGAVITIHNSDFKWNSASSGGGVYLVGGNQEDEPTWWPDVTIQNSTFDSNSASYGGAVYTLVDTNLVWTTFTKNQANGSETSAAGGALYVTNYNMVQAYGLTLTENLSAGPGGAVALIDGGQFFANVMTFEGNTAPKGGAVYVGRDSSAEIWKSNFTGNEASQRGGGVFVDRASSFDLQSSLFTGNSAGANGGAVSLLDAPADRSWSRPASLLNNTISDNHAPTGAGVDIAGRSLAQLTNNIIAFNDLGVRVEPNATATFFHNDVHGNGTDFSGIPSPVGQNGNLNIDPGFVNRAGGDYHLASSSPLVDQGDAGEFYYWATDLDGERRVRGVNVDLGAYERPGAGYTFLRFDAYQQDQAAAGPLADPVKVSVLSPSGSVLTSYNGPVTISLRPDSGTIGATLGGTLTVDAVNGVATFADLTIDKPGIAYVLTASLPGQGGRHSNAFAVMQPVVRVSTSGNDRADGATWATAKRTLQAGLEGTAPGGAVYLAQGTYHGPFMSWSAGILGGFVGSGSSADTRDPALRKTILEGEGVTDVLNIQRASAPIAFDGLTIHNGTGNGVLNFADGVTLSNNVIAANGNHGILTFGDDTRITRNDIRWNTSPDYGGGILIAGGSAVVDNNVIDGNTARNGSGVASYTFGAVSLVNNTIVGGQGTYGAVWLERGTVTLANNIVSGNSSGLQASADRPPNATLIKNIVYGNQGVPYKDLTPGPSDILADPLLRSGPGSSYIPGPASPAIDAGDLDSVVGTLDFLGNPRIAGQGVDIGAIEVQPGLSMGDVSRALAIAGGLETADSGDMTALNVHDTGTSAGVIDVLDALKLMRTLMGGA